MRSGSPLVCRAATLKISTKEFSSGRPLGSGVAVVTCVEDGMVVVPLAWEKELEERDLRHHMYNFRSCRKRHGEPS